MSHHKKFKLQRPSACCCLFSVKCVCIEITACKIICEILKLWFTDKTSLNFLNLVVSKICFECDLHCISEHKQYYCVLWAVVAHKSMLRYNIHTHHCTIIFKGVLRENVKQTFYVTCLSMERQKWHKDTNSASQFISKWEDNEHQIRLLILVGPTTYAI